MNALNEAADAVENFANGPGAEAANALGDVFEQAGDRIASALEQAAQSGELSFQSMAESVLNDLARIAVNELITAPLQAGVSALSASLINGSTKPVSPVTVNLNMSQPSGKSGGPEPSAAQIAGQVAQAVARAQTRR